MRKYLSQTAAAKILGVSRETLRRDRARPEGEERYPRPVALVDGRPLYSPDDVDFTISISS